MKTHLKEKFLLNPFTNIISFSYSTKASSGIYVRGLASNSKDRVRSLHASNKGQETIDGMRDIVVATPIVFLQKINEIDRRFIIENSNEIELWGYRYLSESLPFPKYTSKNLYFEVESNQLNIYTCNGKNVLVIYLEGKFIDMLVTSRCFTLVTEYKDHVYSVGIGKRPEIPYIVKKINGIAPQYVKNSKKVAISISSSRMVDVSLDSPILSDKKSKKFIPEYYTYISSNSTVADFKGGVSIPSIKSAGGYCVVCFSQGMRNLETTIEHCIPKWLCDRLNTEPLTSNILCQEHNNKFGKSIEESIKLMYQDKKYNFHNLLERAQIPNDPIWGNNFKARELGLRLMGIWCYKTAIFASIASGITIPPIWVEAIDNLNIGNVPEIPSGFKIAYSPYMVTEPSVYTYGVSEFGYKGDEDKDFLFTFSCSNFSFYVYKTDVYIDEPYMYNIYPSFRYPEYDARPLEFSKWEDVHEYMHSKINPVVSMQRWEIKRNKSTPWNKRK